jgi:phosphatidylserine/phosphatidylglycerophosphate/cardiolipin synthase-like enzyme
MKCLIRVCFLLLVFPLSSFADSLSVTPRDGHLFFTNAFDRAMSSIDLVMFHLSDEDDAQHLISASQRGVKIRVILDRGLLRGSTAQRIAQELSNAGIQVKASPSAFTITHEKAAIIDHSTALISSINLTQNGAFTRDFGVATADADVITEMDEVFNMDWNNSASDATVSSTPPVSNAKLLWSPVNAKDKIIALINSAQKSLALEVENLGDWDVLNALKAKAQSGVVVVAISPGCVEGAEPERNIPLLQELADAGVDARAALPPYSAENPYIHAKTIVVDGVNFYVGSENFSHNSLASAREVGLMENDADISQQILQVIKIDYGNAKAVNQLQAYRCTTQ